MVATLAVLPLKSHFSGFFIMFYKVNISGVREKPHEITGKIVLLRCLKTATFVP
jgi:hypothetical protein